MTDVVGKISTELHQAEIEPPLEDTANLITGLIEQEAYVGDVYSLSYADLLKRRNEGGNALHLRPISAARPIGRWRAGCPEAS